MLCCQLGSTLFEKHLCNQHGTTKLTLFTVSKDEWNTKEVHEECIVHIAGTSRAEAMLKIKPIALAFISLNNQLVT